MHISEDLFIPLIMVMEFCHPEEEIQSMWRAPGTEDDGEFFLVETSTEACLKLLIMNDYKNPQWLDTALRRGMKEHIEACGYVNK